MKKIHLFFSILMGLIVFFSCSRQDDSNTASMAIIGTWKLKKQVRVCSTGSEESDDFATCLQGELTFKSDGTATDLYFCDDSGQPVETLWEGTWTLSGENLTINYNGLNFDTTYLEVTRDTLRIGYYTADQEILCDEDNFQSLRYQEYIRLE